MSYRLWRFSMRTDKRWFSIRAMPPKDGNPIVALCLDNINPYQGEARQNYETYQYLARHFGAVSDGIHILVWVDGTLSYKGHPAMPGWWFLNGSDGEVAANPVAWLPIPVTMDSPVLDEMEQLSSVDLF